MFIGVLHRISGLLNYNLVLLMYLIDDLVPLTRILNFIVMYAHLSRLLSSIRTKLLHRIDTR
jgi:hypothetical protein